MAPPLVIPAEILEKGKKKGGKKKKMIPNSYPRLLLKPGICGLQIKSGVHKVHIFLIQLLPQQFHGLTESLEMDNFPLPEEPDYIVDIGIVRKP